MVYSELYRDSGYYIKFVGQLEADLLQKKLQDLKKSPSHYPKIDFEILDFSGVDDINISLEQISDLASYTISIYDLYPSLKTVIYAKPYITIGLFNMWEPHIKKHVKMNILLSSMSERIIPWLTYKLERSLDFQF